MRYTLHIEWREDKAFKQVDKIEADDLVHLVSQLMFVLLDLQRKSVDLEIEQRVEERLKIREIEDDIPF